MTSNIHALDPVISYSAKMKRFRVNNRFCQPVKILYRRLNVKRLCSFYIRVVYIISIMTVEKKVRMLLFMACKMPQYIELSGFIL